MIGRWLARRQVRKSLDGCDYKMAKELLIENLGGGVLPNDLVRLLEAFSANPCFDTAIKLIELDEKFMAFFELSCPGSLYHLNKSNSP